MLRLGSAAERLLTIAPVSSILWTALFGTFGSIYIPANPTPKQSGQIRMKHAVWVDLVNMLLWFITAIYSTFIWWRHRHNMTLHTGRGKV